MIKRLIPSGVAAAIAGGTVAVALSCCPPSPRTSSRFIITATPSIILTTTIITITPNHPYHYDHYNSSYRVRHYVPKTNPYHHPYHY